MKKSLSLVAAVAALTWAVSTAATGTAAAAEAPHSAQSTTCSSGDVCLWFDTHRGGNEFVLFPGWDGTCSESLTNAASVANERGSTVRFYSNTTCGGSYFDLNSGTYSDDAPFPVESVRVIG